MMRVIFIKGSVIRFMLIVGIGSFLLTFYKPFQMPVYKDRAQWEKSGAIVWEVNVREKLIALTFDDGPSPTFTNKILDLLARYHAKGTFFVMGKQAEKYPGIILREYQEGHEIGNHTYNHREINQMSFEELKREVLQAHQIIFKITGNDVKLFRPTSGFYNEKIVKVAGLLNYKVVIWTWGQDSRDWSKKSGESIAMRIIKTVKPGDIILFHDQGGDHSNTVKALQILLPALKEQGYQFTTVSTLLQYRH
jgi:peptidoglycan-N-acetylglucosamine deacetylase